MTDPIKIDPVVLNKEQMDSYTQLFADESGGAAPVLAEQLTNRIAVDYPELITYSGLRDGTAPLFDQLPSFKSLSPEDRSLTNNDIISLFAVDEQGEPIKEGTFTEGFLREILPSGISASGAYTGAKIGARLAAPIPGVTPWTIAAKAAIPTITTIAGALGFYEAGKGGTDLLFGPEKPITPGSRAAYEAGKTTAGAAGWLALPYMISKNVQFGAAQYLDNLAEGTKGPLNTRLIAGMEKLLSKTGESARSNPIAFATIEAGAGLGAAGGTSIAESVDPGDESTRLMLEIPFGISGGILASRITALKPALRSLKETYGKLRRGEFQIKGRRQRAAADRILDIIESEGEDVEAIIERLASREFEEALIDPDTKKPITLSAGMKANSPALLAIEASLAQTSPGLGKEKTAKNIQANNALRNTISALVATGNPEALQMAAQLSEDVFSAGLNNRLRKSAENVLKAYERVGGKDPESNRALSQKLFDLASTQLSQARSQENRLWNAVGDVDINVFRNADGEEIDVPNFISAWQEAMPRTPEAAQEIQSKLGRLNQFVERKRKDLGLDREVGEEVGEEVVEEIIPLTSTEVTDMRKIALSLARQLTASQDYNSARIASNFAEGLLDDLNYGVLQGEDAAYDIARAYSKSLNDTFTRAFAGRVLEKSRTGSQRMAPELLANRLLTGGSDPTYLRIKEINDIGQFAVDNGLEGAADIAATVSGTQEMIVRNARAAAFDPKTGEINLKALGKWVDSNKELLDVFPALRADLKNAERANVVLKGRQAQNKAELDKLKGQITFRDLLPENTESPTFVVARALANGQKAPIRSLDNLWEVVEDAPEELREEAASGLKHSILEWAMTKGGATSRSFSPREMYDSLFSKIPNAISNVSVMDWMLQKGAIQKSQANNMKRYLTEMVRLEVMDSQGTLGDVAKDAGPMLDFYLRITGSALGSRMQGLLPGGGGSGTLIAAQAGSKMMRNIFEKVPESMKMDVMSELMEQPELLADLLSKPRTQKEKLRITKAIGFMLEKLGFIESVGQTPRRVVPQVISDEEIEPRQPNTEQNVRESQPQASLERSPVAPTGGASAPGPRPFVVAQLPVAQQPPAQTTADSSGVASLLPAGSTQANAASQQRYAAAYPNDSISDLIRMRGTA